VTVPLHVSSAGMNNNSPVVHPKGPLHPTLTARIYQPISTTKAVAPVIRVDRIEFLHTQHRTGGESPNSKGSSSSNSSGSSTTARGRRRFRNRPTSIQVQSRTSGQQRMLPRFPTSIPSSFVEVLNVSVASPPMSQHFTAVAGAFKMDEDEDSSFSSLSSYESGSESDGAGKDSL
jgi:hypothetical protein